MFIRFILQNIPQKSRFVPNTFFFVKIIFIMVSISTKHDNMHKNIYKKYIQKKPRKTPKNKYQKKTERYAANDCYKKRKQQNPNS